MPESGEAKSEMSLYDKHCSLSCHKGFWLFHFSSKSNQHNIQILRQGTNNQEKLLEGQTIEDESILFLFLIVIESLGYRVDIFCGRNLEFC